MSGKYILMAGFGLRMGEALAEKLISDGCIPLIVSRTESKLRDFVSKNDKSIYFGADLSTEAGIKSLGDFLRMKNIKISGMAILLGGYFTDRIDSPGDVVNLLKINVAAPMQLVSGLLDNMQGSCSVVLASSFVTLVPKPNNPLSYTVSKYALNGLVQNMAAELVSRNVRVNAVAISAIGGRKIKDNQFRLGDQNASADDIAEIMAFLLSEKSFLIDGAIIPVDGGLWLR